MGFNKKLVSSAAFSSGAKFLGRAIGLFSTLILARILTPDDFAMIAIIAIILHFFDIMSHSGSEQYIIQKTAVSDIDLNTAWTLDIILKTSMCVLLIFVAPFIVEFFDKTKLSFAMQVAAITLIINALKNPGLLLLKRNLEYKSVFYLALIQRIVSFVIVIWVALSWQSYWAFIIADIAGAIVLTMGSYKVHFFRPSMGLKNVTKQWQFSQWLMGKSIVGYLRAQIDTVLVAKFFNAGQLGNYHMARDVAMLPGHNLLGPAIEPLLADFKDYKTRSSLLANRVSKALCIISFLVVPITLYMALNPELIVSVLLGSQWNLAGSLLGIMAWLFFYYCFLLVIESALTAIGKLKTIFIFDLFSLIVIGACLFTYLQFSQDLNNLLLFRVLIGIVSTLMIGLTLHYYIGLRYWRIFAALGLASLLSLAALYFAQLTLQCFEMGLVTQFIASGSVFCIAYVGLIVTVLPSLLGTSIQEVLLQYK